MTDEAAENLADAIQDLASAMNHIADELEEANRHGVEVQVPELHRVAEAIRIPESEK
jgi:hypothetical protein